MEKFIEEKAHFIPHTDIKPGQVFETEYGDFDNFVKIVYESHEIIKNGREIKTDGHYLNDGSHWTGYTFCPDKEKRFWYKVIGHVEME